MPFYIVCYLFRQIPISAVVSFVEALEVGYSKHKNPYHNLMHAADVTQTVHYLLLKTGMVVSRAWEHSQASELECCESVKRKAFCQHASQSIFVRSLIAALFSMPLFQK